MGFRISGLFVICNSFDQRVYYLAMLTFFKLFQILAFIQWENCELLCSGLLAS